jgi:hypothetical protein
LAKATTAFQNSLHTEEVPLQQGAYYNLGNTQFRLGQKTEKSNPKETIATWEKAVGSYEAALQIEPGDKALWIARLKMWVSDVPTARLAEAGLLASSRRWMSLSALSYSTFTESSAQR